MQRAGYAQNQYDKLKGIGMEFDFYLTHHITDKIYSREWRLFYPKGF